ncbi:phage tail protein [Clostridium saccharoperbutylacetonicum]
MGEAYYSILTSIGKAKIANALGLGNKIDFVKMKIGDGGGTYYNPTEDQKDLVHTVWEGTIGHVEIDEDNSNWINIIVLIPPDVGGFFIREYAVFDADNNMLAISKCAETYKPLPSDGSTKEISIKMVIAVSNASSITLKIDPTILFAKKKEVDEISSKVNQLSESLNNINAQLSESVNILTPITGSTANAILLNIATLTNNKKYSFKASVNSTGNVTINGKAFKKLDGTQISSSGIKANKVYDFYYDGKADCVFILAKAEGDATVANVLAGKIFSNGDDTGLVGTLDLSNLVSGNIKSGVTINGVSGKASVVDTADANASAGQILNGQTAYISGNKVIGNMPNHSGADSPANSIAGTGAGRIYVRPQAGYYDGSVASYVDDGNYNAANIVNGKSIFGLWGNATVQSLGGRQYTSGPVTNNTTVTLPFNPSIIKINSSGTTFFIWTTSNYGGSNISAAKNTNYASYNGAYWAVNGNKIIFSTLDTSYTWTWEAWQ